MKFTRKYTITTAEMDAHYRLTVDGLLTYHETTIATYLTTLHLAAFDLHKIDKAWVLSEINLELPEPPTMWSEDVEMTVWISEMSSMRVWFDFTAQEAHTGKVVECALTTCSWRLTDRSFSISGSARNPGWETVLPTIPIRQMIHPSLSAG